MSHERTATICIGGMTCASCELLLERKLKHVAGVERVDADHKSGTATIVASAETLPNNDSLAAAVREAGYEILDRQPPRSQTAYDLRKWLEIGLSLAIILVLAKVFGAMDLVSIAPSTSGALSLGGVFLIGLVAGTSSCLAVTGGLLVALAAKHNELHPGTNTWHKFQPLLHFNLGRIVSYFVLGGLVGALGQSITLSTRMSGYMNIAIALVMLYLACTILGLIPKGSFPIRPSKAISRRIAGLSESGHPAAPLTLGALTFFLPCGFTQSLQFAALASGSAVTGALMMGMFSLGTLPSLLGLSALSSTATGTFGRLFLRFSGTFVLVLALYNLQNGLALAGF